MTQDSPRTPLNVAFPAVLAFAATLLLYAGMGWYVRNSAPFLQAFDRNIGECIMKEGMRLQDAGDPHSAQAVYLAALRARFEGPQNRATTEYRLGLALEAQGLRDEAVSHLRNAVEQGCVAAYPSLCENLLRLEHFDDLRRFADAWKRAPALGKAQKAQALYFFGKAALLQGDAPAAEKAFQGGYALEHRSVNACALAELYAGSGKREAAEPLWKDCLDCGAPEYPAAVVARKRNGG